MRLKRNWGISEQKPFSSMISLDQMNISLEIKDRVIQMSSNEQHHKIFNLLTNLDHFIHHNEANARQQKDTGSWFFDIDEYKSWQNTSNSLLWLHGMDEHSLLMSDSH
ncbi:hypothetical protein AcW1_006809 [Taiwanofungus camphoratus]|nr:hypothetical protein AcW1_006809 [Antrodia cinnamomea]